MSRLSSESMDNVHGGHGQCPLRPMDIVHWIHGHCLVWLVYLDFVHGLIGLCPEYPWTLSRLSTESMVNVHWVHGQCPGSPMSLGFWLNFIFSWRINSLTLKKIKFPWHFSDAYEPCIDDIVQGIVLSVFIGSLWNLLISWAGIKSHVFKIWPEWMIYFGVTCLDCWKDHIWPGHVGLRWAIIDLWATCF